MFLKLAQDTLLDPAKRFAYDRFGPSILNWGNEKTMQDFLYAAMQRSIIPQYVGGFVTIIFLNFTWWSDWGRYVSVLYSLQNTKTATNSDWQWRFLTFAALLTLELTLITHSHLAVFTPASLLPEGLRNTLQISDSISFYLLPFQVLQIARQASIILHIFISQLTPPELAKKSPSTPGERLDKETMQKLGQMVNLSRATDLEATRLLQMGYAPFRGDKEGIAALRKGMKEGLVLSGVRSSPEVQQAVTEVVERRKRESKVE